MRKANVFLFFIFFVSVKSFAQDVIYQTTSPGPGNTRIGIGSGNNTSTHGLNTFIGTQTGMSNTDGEFNTFLGHQTGANNTSGADNVFIGGFHAGFSNTIGKSNVMIGRESGLYSKSGDQNVFIGYFSGGQNINGIGNCYIGSTTGGSGSSNVAIGGGAGQGSTGSLNIAIGSGSGKNAAGSNNIFMGVANGYSLASGNDNIILGGSAGIALNTGSYNLMMGYYAGGFLTTATGNTLLGNNCARDLSTGNNNTFLGNVRVFNTPSTATGVGNNISNSVILADGAQNYKLIIDSNGFTGIGLGNYARPQAMLDVNGPPLFRYLPVSTSNTYFLSADIDGRVSKQQLNFSGAASNLQLSGNILSLTSPLTPGNAVTIPNIYTANGALTIDRTVSLDNKRLVFNTSTSGRVYIGNSNTTAGSPANYATLFPTLTSGNYRLFVEDGILTEKVKVALKGTSDWADYVFADNYNLMSLKEVESFIKVNQHLPGVPAAAELVKEGLDLGDMHAKQMEKIEELTLYAIEQDKKLSKQDQALEKQNQEIAELKAQVKLLMDKK